MRLIIILVILLLIVMVVYFNTQYKLLQSENNLLKKKFEEINIARIEYHKNKSNPNGMELFYRRRLLSTLDDILITLFHH